MSARRYTYPARLEPDEDGRPVVHFPDLPEALTDGADEPEALVEASDCLSEAPAGRIHRRENIPIPSPLQPGMHAIEPDPTIALKAALYDALRTAGIGFGDLAIRLGIEERQAMKLIDPKTRASLTKLEEALSALGYTIGIEVRGRLVA
ncbi:MAG: type II toxin-antitoxin system HicB family antitoxin [Thiohalocapsa sp.]